MNSEMNGNDKANGSTALMSDFDYARAVRESVRSLNDLLCEAAHKGIVSKINITYNERFRSQANYESVYVEMSRLL